MKLGIDVNRHKEIIVKAISALMLLLLKHLKLNHIYQVNCVVPQSGHCQTLEVTSGCTKGNLDLVPLSPRGQLRATG